MVTEDFKMGPKDAMKSCAVLSLVIAVAAILVGCSQQKEVAVPEINKDKAVGHEPKQVEQPKNGDHKHTNAFADPAERAKKWNDPKRDKWQHAEEIVGGRA